MGTIEEPPAARGAGSSGGEGTGTEEVLSGLAVLGFTAAVAVGLYLLLGGIDGAFSGGATIVLAVVGVAVVGNAVVRRAGRGPAEMFHTLLGTVIAAVAVGAVVALITGTAPHRLGGERIFGLVEFRVETGRDAAAAALPAFDVRGVAVVGDEVLVRLTDLDLLGQVLARLVNAAPLLVVLAAAVPLYALAGALRAGGPVRARIPRRLYQAGAVVTFGGTAAHFLVYGCHLLLLERAGGAGLTVPLEVPILPLLCGVALFALSEAFEHGTGLRRELAELV